MPDDITWHPRSRQCTSHTGICALSRCTTFAVHAMEDEDSPGRRSIHATCCIASPHYRDSPLDMFLTDYPADGDNDDDEDEDEDEEEEEHLASADSVPPVHRMTARMVFQRMSHPLSLHPRKRQLPSSPLPIPHHHPRSPTHIEIPESCLPLRKRVRFASPTPSHEVRESSAAGAARQDRPAIARDDPYFIAREDFYGFIDMVDVTPGHPMSRELDYGITDTWD
ncbi:hypothetical protein Tco_1184599 [Tanacetum coccineum]